MPTLEVPPQFGYVILFNLCLVGYYCVLRLRVNRARWTMNVPFPAFKYAVRGTHARADEFNLILARSEDFIVECVYLLPLSLVAGLHQPVAVALAGAIFLLGTAEIPDDDFGQVKHCGVLAILAVLGHFAYSLLQEGADEGGGGGGGGGGGAGAAR